MYIQFNWFWFSLSSFHFEALGFFHNLSLLSSFLLFLIIFINLYCSSVMNCYFSYFFILKFPHKLTWTVLYFIWMDFIICWIILSVWLGNNWFLFYLRLCLFTKYFIMQCISMFIVYDHSLAAGITMPKIRVKHHFCKSW